MFDCLGYHDFRHSSRHVSGFCLTSGHDGFLLLSFQLFIYRSSCHSSLCDKNRAEIALVGKAACYGLDGPVIETRCGAKFSAPVENGPGTYPASCTMGTGSLSWRLSDQGVALTTHPQSSAEVNPLNPELNHICYLLALLGDHYFLHVSRIRVKSLTFRRLMSYIYIYMYMEHPFLMFLDHTQRRSTVGRTHLDE